jgi:type I restriction enzyme S subunit
VVIATRVGLGKICIVEEDTAINQDLKGIIPKNTELLDTDFLFFWFKSISKIIINAGTGATVQGVKLPFIKSLKIPDIDITSQKKLASSAKFISKQSELLARIYNKKSNDLAVLKAAILKQELQPSEAA